MTLPPADILSVSETLRRNFGTVRVKGMIIGVSKLFKMISKVQFYCDNCQKLIELDFPLPVFGIVDIEKRCDKCNRLSKNYLNLEFKNTIIVELQDIDTFNDLNRLSIFLFDKDTERIRVGEAVVVEGDIQIHNYSKKRYFAYVYSESIQYLNREDFTLTKLDIEAIKRFKTKKGQNVINGLVSLFDPSIVGYEHVKKGLLYSAVNTSDKICKSEHLDVLLIGDPGLAKTKLLKRTTEFVPGSSMESAQNSSGKSLTAIIEKSDENTFLRLGAIPSARSAICGLNELARMSIEDQAHLLDVMEEREFTINKHGIHSKILSPTTIIGSANPINRSKWKDNYKVDLNEFPILEPIIDRFSVIFVFKSRKELNEINEFVDNLSDVEDKKDKGKIPNYTPFLVKYIQYSKQFNPLLTEEAREMLKEFYKKVYIKEFGSPRVLITLHKLIKAIARLKLKNVADETDAKEVMEFYNVMLFDFQKNVVISQAPKEVAYHECITILKEVKEIGGITIEELIKQVCIVNDQLSKYFGYDKDKSFKIRDNHKIRNLCDILLNHSNIKRVQEKPIVLQWIDSSNFSDECDQCDQCDHTFQEEDNKKNLIIYNNSHDQDT